MSESPGINVRPARHGDIVAIEQLIQRSVRALSAGYYERAQVESALRYMFGVDSQLIDDGTYHVVEANGAIAAAGGWSRRRTLFGGDQWKHGADEPLDATREAARIRAFFVDPAWARRGLGRSLFEVCRDETCRAGFRRLELMATLPGEPLYSALGFRADERLELALPDGVQVPLVRMSLALAD
jgi:GNAT superfamily N-acetyltransferase